jgi:hypothetical protein
MFKLQVIERHHLFTTPEGNTFPANFILSADIKNIESDMDVIIGAHNQSEAVNTTIENYLALEEHSSLHIIVIESSSSVQAFRRIKERRNISKAWILNPVLATSRRFGGRLWASNGAALAAQLGCYFGKAPLIFFSHSDMIGYKKNFLSFLGSKLDDKTPIASFTQRHIIPFTGGMLAIRKCIDQPGIDWLPKEKNSYSLEWKNQFYPRIQALSWIDAGEQIIYASLVKGSRAYVCASRGATGDFFGHPLDYYQISEDEVSKAVETLDYAPIKINKEEFTKKYPELANDELVWRKCFDDTGEVIFIHRGRGTSKGRRKDKRGDFLSFAKEFNRKINKVQS